MREIPVLYDVAKTLCLETGFSWTDPRTGETFRLQQRKPKRKKKV